MPKHLSFLLLFTVLFGNSASADTFIVTSNADSGPGTLREAITMANANGTTLFDDIIFNIAGTTQAIRTIVLQSQLPALSSNITIDGSTQAGSSFGISQAKIILYLDHFTSFPFTYLLIQNATEVKIFGICFGYFEDPDNGGSENYAIQTKNSSNITIGLPGKGNLFSGVRMSITNSPWNYVNDSVSNMTIQSNVFGQNLFSQNNGRGTIYLRNAATILIGGNLQEEGNIFISASIILNETANSAFSFFATIKNNRFGSNWDGTVYYSSGGNIELWGNITDNITSVKTEIKNNLITRGSVRLNQLYHTTFVQGNKIGTDVTGLNCIDVVNIGTGNCKQVIIGGHLAEEENIVNGNIYSPRHGTHIIKNIISGYYGSVSDPDPAIDPFIKILTYDNNLITGTANPNAKIQLYTISCNTWCRSKTYAATVYANNSGNWSFPYLSTDPNFVATATTADSSTSAFTEPKVDHTTSRAITHATCGRNNGSITGIKVYEGSHIRWYDSHTMQLISTDTNLVNVPAGSYVLMVSNGANGCPWSTNLVIENIQPPPVVNPSIVDASCGQNNGSIITSFSGYGSKWLNANYDSIGTGHNINNLHPGTYYLKLWIGYDTSCNKTYGPFTINNLSGPSLNTTNAQITNATCENNNGSITGITANNVMGTPFIQWVDLLNNQVGNSLDLTNVPAGKYRLKFKDQGGCDTIITPFYTILAVGKITIDTTNKIIGPAGCTVNNGSIRNILVTGADNLQWQNISTGSPAGNTADINNLSAGVYKLTATNIIGCTNSITITVPQAAFMPIGVTSVQSRNAICGENNGIIRILSFNNNQSLYSFRWIDSASNQQVSAGTSALNLAAGTYFLIATDANGCEKQIFKSSIGAYPKPTFDYSQMRITNDNCSLQKGSISGITISGVYGPTTYRWVNSNNDTVSSSLNLSNLGADQYKLIVTDAGICTVESNWITVSNTDISLNDPLYNEVTIPRNTNGSFTPANPETATYLLYADPNSSTPIQQNNTGQFTVGPLANDTILYVQKISGSCSTSTVAVSIKVVDKSFFAIASAFTPNNDGLNDRLNLKVIGLIDVEYFRVFNRNGEMVFSTKTINAGWDGRWKGQEQSSAVYVWVAKGKDINGKIITAKGTSLLIK